MKEQKKSFPLCIITLPVVIGIFDFPFKNENVKRIFLFSLKIELYIFLYEF